jgi:hypothetical protein
MYEFIQATKSRVQALVWQLIPQLQTDVKGIYTYIFVYIYACMCVYIYIFSICIYVNIFIPCMATHTAITNIC